MIYGLMRTVLKCLLFLLLGNAAVGQQAKQYSFKHFSVVNGLASNTVSDVMQDKEGYIWIATINGLQRFDGNSFILFRNRSTDSTTIPSNHIIFLFLDRSGNLW